MTDRKPQTDLYGPMPDLGTMKICVFCHMVVTLKRAKSDWSYWCAERDEVDGRHHCDGGQPARHTSDTVLLTLHLPAAIFDDVTGEPIQKWYHRYTPEGEGRFA